MGRGGKNKPKSQRREVRKAPPPAAAGRRWQAILAWLAVALLLYLTLNGLEGLKDAAGMAR